MRGLDYTCNYVVLNPYHKWSVISWGTIAHEIVHLKNAIFQAKGIIPTVDNDEPETYLVGYLMNKITEFYLECMEKEKFPAPTTETFLIELDSQKDEQSSSPTD